MLLLRTYKAYGRFLPLVSETDLAAHLSVDQLTVFFACQNYIARHVSLMFFFLFLCRCDISTKTTHHIHVLILTKTQEVKRETKTTIIIKIVDSLHACDRPVAYSCENINWRRRINYAPLSFRRRHWLTFRPAVCWFVYLLSR